MYLMPELTVGQYVSKRLSENRMSQKELLEQLEALGISRSSSTVSAWLSDKNPVPIELFLPLAKALKDPSPAKLYELAGVLDSIPGGEIVKMLRDAPQEQVDRAERIIKALLREQG